MGGWVGRLSLGQRKKKLYFYFLKDWPDKIIGLWINKIWYPNKIIVFSQEILRHYKNIIDGCFSWHMIITNIKQRILISQLHDKIHKGKTKPYGKLTDILGNLRRESWRKTCTPQWGPDPRLWFRDKSETAVTLAQRSPVCFGPKGTGFISGHSRSGNPKLSRELRTWSMIRLVFRNTGSYPWNSNHRALSCGTTHV